ncbi:glycosyltransferase family 2 protein [Flavitalea antarctica]
MISVVILTKDEENDLPKCLESLKWCDDIHVLDSGSTDKTIAIANLYTRNVTYNPFLSFGQQRNFALDSLPLKYQWILFLDADEVSSDEFQRKVMEAVQTADEDTAGFYCCWKLMLNERWLKRSDNFPKWQFRLLKMNRARFTDFGHGQKEFNINGRIGYIDTPYIHYGFSKGWSHWMARHNKYSTLEAKDRVAQRPPLNNVFSKHGSIRNPALKSWLSRVPGWPLIRFFYSYILKMGFLEGRPGFVYCLNMAYYEFLIQLKMRELRDEVKPGTVKSFRQPVGQHIKVISDDRIA